MYYLDLLIELDKDMNLQTFRVPSFILVRVVLDSEPILGTPEVRHE